jgi:hypothetical protein
MYNRVEVVTYLLDDLGLDVNETGEQGYTPLHLAAKFDYPRLGEALLARGARLDLLTREENTARDLAAARSERAHGRRRRKLASVSRGGREVAAREARAWRRFGHGRARTMLAEARSHPKLLCFKHTDCLGRLGAGACVGLSRSTRR